MLKSLQNSVKAINPAFYVTPCPEQLWTPTRQVMVARDVLECVDCGGVYEFSFVPYPQLFMPSGDYIDCNMVKALATRTLAAAKAHSRALNEARYSGTHPQARAFAEAHGDELRWYAARKLQGFRGGWRKGRNAMDQIRRTQDKLGRELR